MKQLLVRFPLWSRIGLALVLGVAALFLSGFIYSLVPIKPYFPFVAETLMLLATWWLYRTGGQNLTALGLNLSVKHMGYLVGGLLLGAATFMAAIWVRTFYTGESWHLSPVIDTKTMVAGLYYILPTVLVQELMFRGYLFTKTIDRFGVVRANVLFAIIFMLVHVIDRDVLKNPVQVVVLAVTIPVGHLWFAAGLLRTKTLFFPIGLHWGNNWAVQYLLGQQGGKAPVFQLSGQPAVFTTWWPLIIVLLLFNGFFLLVTWAIWKGRWRLDKRPVAA